LDVAYVDLLCPTGTKIELNANRQIVLTADARWDFMGALLPPGIYSFEITG
jgi:hypothetical protein